MNKKYSILKTAARLFASQGFEGTTTLQIAAEAGVTEPLIYYHFKGKDEVFTRILSDGFETYFSRLEDLDENTDTEFEKIERLISCHFDTLKAMPHEIFLVMSSCPAKLNDRDHICVRSIEKQRKKLKSFLSHCIKRGIKSGEFVPVPVAPTVELIIGLINGVTRRRALKLENTPGVPKATIDFCRRALCL
jgi:AcrR family transcriptional regulator